MSDVQIPPPALHVDPPPWGWYANVRKLTAAEMSQIYKLTGAKLEDAPLVWMIYSAVAFARRHDRAGYPWSVADNLTMDDLKRDQEDDAEEEPDPT